MSKADKQPKVAREVAESEFVRMCEAFRVDHDVSALPDDEREEFESLRDKILGDFMRGTVVVDAEGLPTYTPESGKALTFHKPTGATLLALETYPNAKQIGNFVAAMADMTETDRATFAKMSARDVNACSRLAKIFLADR